MAWAFKGTMGKRGLSSSDVTNFNGFPLVTALAIGDLAVLAIAVDNNASSDQDEGAVTAVSSVGGTWTKVREFTKSGGSAQAGVTVSVWMLNVTVAVAAGQTSPQVTFSNNTSRDAMGMVGGVFTMATGQLADEVDHNHSVGTGTSISAPSVTVSSGPSYLRVRATGWENNTTFSPGGTWNQIDSTQNAGTGATGIGIAMEYIISSNTSVGNNASIGASSDYCCIHTAFKEIAGPVTAKGGMLLAA